MLGAYGKPAAIAVKFLSSLQLSPWAPGLPPSLSFALTCRYCQPQQGSQRLLPRRQILSSSMYLHISMRARMPYLRCAFMCSAVAVFAVAVFAVVVVAAVVVEQQ